MKSSCQEGQTDNKKKYVFFSDPDVIVKRAETSAIAAQIRRDSEAQRQVFERQSANLPISTFDIKAFENLLSYHPIQPYPFTFISAVKQKLALGNHTNISTRTHNPNSQTSNNLAPSILRTNSTQNLYQVVRKMDFVRPLKVPDLKVSPKTLNFSCGENSVPKDLSSAKSEIAVMDFAQIKLAKMAKTRERVQRKLDFSSSDGSSIINCDNIEPLKAPNVSIASNFKKKEHARDISREKENRSKRLKKDETPCTEEEEVFVSRKSTQDQIKRNKSSKHVSRRDCAVDSTSGAVLTRLKNDRLPSHAVKNNETLSREKSKIKSPVTSAVKKDSNKRQKPLNAQSVELITRDSPLESKSRACGSKVLDFLSGKLPMDSVTTRDGIADLSSNSESKSKDTCHLRQVEDLKYKCDSDAKQLKQDKAIIIHKEQTKRVSDKIKTANSKIEGKVHGANSLSEAEDIGCVSETGGFKNRANIYTVYMKRENSEATMENAENSVGSAKTSESFKCTEHSATAQSTSTSSKKDEESYSQSVVTTKQQTTTDNDTNDVDVGAALPEQLFDPRRISFRDSSYSQQEEFQNLITPDKMDHALKSKQRRYLTQNSDSETDARCSKYKPMVKSEKEQEKVQLMHPTALHMQFQAELHLLDSFNESLRHVMDVEKCLYNFKRKQKPKNPEEVDEEGEEVQASESRAGTAVDSDVAEKTVRRSLDYVKRDVETRKSNACDEAHFAREHYVIPSQGNVDESGDTLDKKFNKAIKVAEVQTQTVNDMATQTDTSCVDKRNAQNVLSKIHEDPYVGRSFVGKNEEVPQLSLDSAEQFEGLDQIEEISLPRIGTMSEISLHETTSSIKTETGTEISISTRDITCSFMSKEFNKYLNLEIEKLIKDEDKRYDKYEMLFKSHEKTLNDRTRKLVKLQEQKRALKDRGEESRVSSLKKKQRAVLLKIEQERDEILRLKELHHATSKQRKLMLQRQKDLLDLQMSTKEILTKLKRSADSQSPRRLSGPMKGYDILSNSSISSLIDSDKSQHDRSQMDARLQASESDAHLSKLGLAKTDKFVNLTEESNTSATRFDELIESNELQEQGISPKSQKKNGVSSNKYELKSRKYEDKMPKAHFLRLKQSQFDVESKRLEDCPMKIKRLIENPIEEASQSSRTKLDASVPDYAKSESDTLVEELSKRSRTSQMMDPVTVSREKELVSSIVTANNGSVEKEINSKAQDATSKTTKSLQIPEDALRTNVIGKGSKKTDKSITSDRDATKKLQHNAELRISSKRKSSKHPKTKSSGIMEDILRSKSSSHLAEELTKHYDKQTRMENESFPLENNNESSVLGELDLNESQSSLQALVRHSKAVKDKNSKLLSEMTNDHESKENISDQVSNRKHENGESLLHRGERAAQNVSASQISTFAISHHSSEESERNFSKSVVVRSQDKEFKASKKLEQILTARETALASRKNCVEEWLAWHTRLRAEEDRVFRMEEAALKLAAATSNVLSQQDTTVSSDTSDVEGRIEILTKKLAERRVELSRLKREARKQTKQKLRALEANLLNQIKKYDTTIHEMRKKLESKKTVKNNDKLAIESKSLADFKVPKMPIKRIQDIYKSSDLLRSRSESDLLSTRDQQENLLKIAIPTTYSNTDKQHQQYERNGSQRSTKSADNGSTNVSELRSAGDVNRSVHTTFEECTSTEERDKLRTAASVLSSIGDARSERDERQQQQLDESADVETTRRDSDAENVRTIIDTARSGSEVRTISDATRSSEDPRDAPINTESADRNGQSNARASVDRSQTGTSTGARSEILEEAESVNCTRSVRSGSDYTTESAARVTVAASDRDVLSFSKKLDYLQLNNRNLNEDISSLENGLKVLSEMVSRFSSKTNEKPKADNDERSTLQDISEEIMSEPFLTINVLDHEEEKRTTSSSEREINTESLPASTNDGRSKSSGNLSHDKSESANSAISAVIPEALGLSDSAHEIDYEARSKEIMNEIERSIISEYTKVARGDYNVSTVLENDMQNLRKDNEELLNDLASLELDVKSISEILSKVSESRRDLDLAAKSAKQIVNESRKAKLAEDLAEDRETSAAHSPKLSERRRSSSVESTTHSPIIAGHRSKEIYETNSRGTLSSAARSSILSRGSRVLHVGTENSKSSGDISEVLEAETNFDDGATLSRNFERDEDVVEDIQTALLDDMTMNSTALASKSADQNQSISAGNKDDGWTTSDSFEVPQNDISTGSERGDKNSRLSRSDRDANEASNNFSKWESASRIDDTMNQRTGTKLMSDVNASIFIPKGESTNIEVHDVTPASAIVDSRVTRNRDELDDILDIIAKENDQEESVSDSESGKLDNVIVDSLADLLDQVESIVENGRENVDSCLRRIARDNEVDVLADNLPEAASDVPILNLETQKDKINAEDADNREGVMDTSSRETNDEVATIANEDSPREAASEAREIIITELDSDSLEEQVLSELEIDAKVELAEEEEEEEEEEEFVDASDTNERDDGFYRAAEESRKSVIVEIEECLEPISEQDSSDGEQLDNLVEVAESGLDTVEKFVTSSRDSPVITDHEGEVSRVQAEEDREETTTGERASARSQDKMHDEGMTRDAPIASELNKTFDIAKDPDYEDISEESLEVSEILDKNELPVQATVAKKSAGLPESYQATRKSEEVLRILDEIARKSSPDSVSESQREERDPRSATEEISEMLGAEDNVSSSVTNERTAKDSPIAERFYGTMDDETRDRSSEEATSREKRPTKVASDAENVGKSGEVSSRLGDGTGRRPSQIIYAALRERVSQLQEQDGSSESSEAGDTPRGVSEIEMDSPRDFNDSRLDIDILDDDLLSGGTKVTANHGVDHVKTNFHPASIVATSEKDIEAMIDKLKASLEQPGLEVAELEAKLLRIEQLQIELEIKKLEAEEVSYYVREIPNKPPPPYTPPGEGRLSGSLGSPTLLTVIPSNVDELTSFTERATSLIYDAKLAGEDVASLDAPAVIYESIKEKNESVRRDRRIYNTFLFDLCKETVTEVYHTEYEKPGPSWTRPNVKTKPTMKIPRTVEELTEYVSKEVATLFGFKTKLQRENMVMRWSRKRRDRVDELLAREAQAEEDEWTKFHHDELAVKNGLTAAILDTLLTETANEVKVAYGKKRRMMV